MIGQTASESIVDVGAEAPIFCDSDRTGGKVGMMLLHLMIEMRTTGRIAARRLES